MTKLTIKQDNEPTILLLLEEDSGVKSILLHAKSDGSSQCLLSIRTNVDGKLYIELQSLSDLSDITSLIKLDEDSYIEIRSR